MRTAAVLSVGILVLAWIPVVEVYLVSFNDAGKVALARGFPSLGAYVSAFDDAGILAAAARSLLVGIGCALVSVVTGGAVAVAAHVVGGRLRSWLTVLYVFPLVTPDVMIGLALNHSATAMGLPLNAVTLVLAHSTFGSALCFFVVAAGITHDVSAAIDSAVTLSLARFGAMTQILRPLLVRALAAGACIALVVSLDDFGVTYFIVQPGKATLPVLLFTRLAKGLTTESFAAACALAFLNAATVVLVLRTFGVSAFGLRGMEE